MIYLLLIIIVLLSAIGQILLKVGANRSSIIGTYNKFVILGYAIFVLVVGISYHAMSLIEFKYFAIMASAVQIMTIVFSRIFLGETTNNIQNIGLFFIAVGIYIFTIKFELIQL